VYRYFPNREALLTALFGWTNARLGFEEKRPDDVAGLLQLVRVVFAGFDELAPVIHALLVAPEGRAARLSVNSARKRAALEVVRRQAPELDAASLRRIAAVVQLLTSAATWQSLREYWGMDGKEAAEASALGLELILAGARARQTPAARMKRSPQGSRSKKRGAS
jgi:AcrR family transcriptional regulator